MSQIICRHANSDFEAFKIAQGMEKAGAQVFAVSFNGTRQNYATMTEGSQFIVWARHDESLSPDQIDEAIEKEFDAN